MTEKEKVREHERAKQMLYINDDGSGSPFRNSREMVDVIKRDAKPNLPRVSTAQKLQIQRVIADAIKEQGGSLYEDNGECMDGRIVTILFILGLK